MLAVSLAVTAGLTLLEWYVQLDVSLGIFYTIPVVIAAFALNRWQIVLLAVCCALVRGFFTPAASSLEFFLKFVMASIAYCGSGLLAVEMSNNRRRVLEHYAKLKLEQELRRRAEEQLRILAESSPAAIITLNSDTVVLAANVAAHEMLEVPPGQLVGQPAGDWFPVFARALKLTPGDRPVRTGVTGWAKRANGLTFPVQAWFSTYGEGPGRCLAAIVVDISEELRDRELDNFQHMLDFNRLLAGAVSHEIRNLCSAIAVVCSNLRETTQLQHNADFEALNHLVNALSHLASFDLQRKAQDGAGRVDLKRVLDQLRVVIEPDWNEVDGLVKWALPETIPPVSGDSYGMLQIFLNLAQNSCRAVASSDTRELTIEVEVGGGDVLVRFLDSGHGVSDPNALFHPFRPGGDGSGLGLYVSRELARSFGGDLIHVPSPEGCRFDVILPVASAATQKAEELSVSRY